MPRMRLTTYVDELTLSYKGVNNVVATVITETVSSMMGWLECGSDFHVSKDEEGTERKSVILVSNGAPQSGAGCPGEAGWAGVWSRTCESLASIHLELERRRLAKIRKRMPGSSSTRDTGRSRARSPRRVSCRVVCTVCDTRNCTRHGDGNNGLWA